MSQSTPTPTTKIAKNHSMLDNVKLIGPDLGVLIYQGDDVENMDAQLRMIVMQTAPERPFEAANLA